MDQKRMVKGIRIGAIVVAVALAGLVWQRSSPSDTFGRAILHIHFNSREVTVLKLPDSWRSRYGIDRQGQCAILMDQSARPLIQACANAYETELSGDDGLADMAKRSAALHLYSDEKVSLDVRQTQLAAVYHVTKTFPSTATFHVVTSGTAVEERFFKRVAGTRLLELIFYEDATQQATLDPIIWNLVEHAKLVQQ